MGKKHRVGDIVLHCIGFNNGRSIDIYGKIINIIDDKGLSYHEYDIITGRGDFNSKVEVIIKPLVYKKDLSVCNIENLSLNPHHVYLRHPKEEIKLIESEIEFLQRKIDFFNRYENRIDKLNSILNDPE